MPIQSAQTSLFRNSKQKDNKSVDRCGIPSIPAWKQSSREYGKISAGISILKPEVAGIERGYRSYLSKLALSKQSCMIWVNLRSHLNLPVTENHCSSAPSVVALIILDTVATGDIQSHLKLEGQEEETPVMAPFEHLSFLSKTEREKLSLIKHYHYNALHHLSGGER